MHGAFQTVDEKEKGKGGEEFGIGEECMHTSFENFEEEATPTPVDFDAGEMVELAVHFHNKKFYAEHIRSFVLDSPIEGWAVNFQPNPFSSATFVCMDGETHNKVAMYCVSKLTECSK